MTNPACATCGGEGWVCEAHPLTPWRDSKGCCGEPGVRCICNPTGEMPLGFKLTDEEFHRRMRADAVSELERVKTLLKVTPPSLLQELDERAAGLERLIREYDTYLAKPRD